MTLHDDRVNIFGRSGSRISRRRAIGYGSLALAGALIGPSVVQPVAAQASAATPISSAILAWEEIDQQLAEVAPTTALLAAELIGDRIESIHETNADQALPIGSNFKLWILGALSLQVEAGTLDWEQMVEIQDAHRSVPGGDLRYVKAGSSFTLRYLAERMIQKSDNTATDHLLFLAGRENVEQAMATMGHSDPAHNIPLLSTRELEMLKFAYPQEQLDAYYAASVDERRRILAEEIAAIPYEALADLDQTEPVEIDRVEWFATRNDLVRTMAWLLVESQKPGLRLWRTAWFSSEAWTTISMPWMWSVVRSDGDSRLKAVCSGP